MVLGSNRVDLMADSGFVSDSMIFLYYNASEVVVVL